MGNQCGGCKSRRRAVNVFDPEDLNSELNFIERPLQRKEKVNSDDEGSSSSGESGSENGESNKKKMMKKTGFVNNKTLSLRNSAPSGLTSLSPRSTSLKLKLKEEGKAEHYHRLPVFLASLQDCLLLEENEVRAAKINLRERKKGVFEATRHAEVQGDIKGSQDLEEACFDDVLGSLYDKLRINAKIFQDSIDYYSKDEEQEEQLGSIVKLTQDSMQVLKREFFSMEEEKAEIELTREQALQVVKTKLDITLKLLMEFREVEQDLKLEIFGDASGEEEEDVIQGK
eukprot:CAMPEP_0170495350 /NCGR_PEP_ID=MMETSP0208-20121228/15158_1 /TAXON_ID=197538 /ORGANISM="Strombidium inclinatum, Strain S3" /LENGTH=284 /DNA_ID=CAMNT_0010771527 /DNA_START=16 /DNA_END=873 /DNA_ORIENTATION=+